MSEPTPLEQAVKAIGGQAATAKALHLTAGMVWQWVNGKRPLPPEHCPRLEELSGIRCEHLRPDIVWTRDQAGQITGYHVPLGSDSNGRHAANDEEESPSHRPKAA